MYGKTAGVHVGHGVVEKKQSGFRNKVWIGKRMVLFGGVCGIMEVDKIEYVEAIKRI